MSDPDAKRRSGAYVLVFCPAAEVLLEKEKVKKKTKKQSSEEYHLVQQFYTCHTAYLLLNMSYIT